MSGRVLITGRGAVTPAGIGLLPFTERLSDGQHTLRLLSEALASSPDQQDEGGLFDAASDELEKLGDPIVGLNLELDLSKALGGRNLRPLDRTSSLLICAAREALEEAGWSDEARTEHEVGLVLGTTFCSSHTIAAFDRRAIVAGPRYASPLDFANTVINAAAGQTAIWHNLRGVNSTIAGESAAALEAIGYGMETIQRGDCDALLVGGAEDLSFETLAGLQAAGMMCGSAEKGEPPARAIPLGLERSGLTAAEGAGLLVLERQSTASERGGAVLGEVLGFGRGFDVSLGSEPEETTGALSNALRDALQGANLEASAVDLLVAGANGSPYGDLAEVLAWHEVFAEGLQEIPVVAPKALFGDSLGASGAVQALAALHVLGGGSVANQVRPEPADPELPAWGYPDELHDMCEIAVLTCAGWSGHCAAVVIGAARDLR